MIINKKIDLGQGKIISIETGKMAKQADGAVVVRLGDTMVLATVVSSKKTPPPNQDYFPLQVEYREKYSAAGKFPGGFFIALIIRIFILPLFSRFSEKRYTHCFVCNSLEFGGITIGVA